MKNLIKTSVFVGILLTSVIVSATSNDPYVRVSTISSKTFNFGLLNFDGKINVYIKDTEGEVLFNENYKGSYYSKNFDFSDMPNGEYFVEIDGQTKITTIPFNVSNHSVNFKNEFKKDLFKPVVRRDGNDIYITKLALKNEALQIAIFDENNNLLHIEELKGEINLSRKFNIEMLEKGVYNFVLKTEGRTFKKQIKKN